MNIKVQCSGIVLLLLISFIYRPQRTLALNASKVFRSCFYASLACLVMDVLSIVGIVYREKLPAFLPVFMCKAYLLLLVLVSLLTVIYVATGVTLHEPHYRKYISVYVLFAIVIGAVICALPIEMFESVEKGLAWTDGPSCYATYFGVLVLISVNMVQIFRHKQHLHERQSRTVLIWLLVWVIAACIQGALGNRILIVGYAMALGIAVVFMQFENPELNLDRNTGLFNYGAYTRYGEQLYSGNKPFYVIAVMFKDASWQNPLITGGAAAKRQDAAFLSLPDAVAFKIMEDEALLIFSSEESAKAAWEGFKSRGAVAPDQTYGAFYYVGNPRCVSSQGELLELLQYVRMHKDIKQGGCYTIEDSIAAQLLSEREMTKQIVEALEEDRVVVYYQPIYSVEQHRFTSAEALVRIVDREGKLVPPGAFISVAENNGLIIEIGTRVFEKVCHFFQAGNLEQYGMQYIEINLSVVQCADEGLAAGFIDIMNGSKIDPRCINLEITESASLRGKQVLISNMEQMIEYGTHFSLDDFGTGASNLNYIVDMPVQIVKFDREMIQAYFASGKAKYVMDAAMHMIHGMGLKIVAEGIETEEQYRKMEEIQIDFIQGYYFSKPIGEKDFLAFLRRENMKA